MTNMNVHQTFLRFFLGIAVVALGQQTYIFLKVVSMASFRLSYLATYTYLWLYGFDVPSYLGTYHIQGAYPALILVAICIIGLKLCGSSRFVPVKAVEV